MAELLIGEVCYDMGRTVCIDYGTEKREGERLEIYRRHQPLQQ
jgi:hypothetical protein